MQKKTNRPFFEWANPLRLFVAMFGVLLLCCGCNSKVSQPKAKNGVLDISSWDLNSHKVRLDGEWEFYWHRLYTPSDFKGNNVAIADYMKVPGFWNFDANKTKEFSKTGYATYRLRVKTNQANGDLCMYIPDANSSYKLWVNGEEISHAGMVGRLASEERASLKPEIKLFSAANELEIVVQVSNFFNYKAGIWQSISIGQPELMMHDRDVTFILSMCLVGTFIILSVYNVFIFLLRRVEYSALWFSLLSFGFGVRTFVIGSRPVYSIFPTVSANFLYRLQYESFLASCVFICLFVFSLFQNEFSRKALNIIVVLGIIELAIIFTAPTLIYTLLLPLFQAKAFIECIFCISILVRAAIQKRRRAIPIMFVLIVMCVGAINDTLYTHGKINTGYTMEYTASLMLLVQAYIVATRISGAYFKFSNLTVALNAANQNLEQKVIERTKELEAEKIKADELLHNILPLETAIELKAKGRSEPRYYEAVSIMLIDMVGFTLVSERIGAELLVAEIDACFSAFDKIIEEHNLEKIKTIGDAYLCAGGLPVSNETHTEDIINAAIRVKEFMDRRKEEKAVRGEISFSVRIGVHTGPVVAGVVGIKKYGYDIWGDTVNRVGTIEQKCEAGMINVSGETYELVKDKFEFSNRGEQMPGMYYVVVPEAVLN